MVGQITYERYNIRLSQVSVGRTVARLGLTCQRPLFRAVKQYRNLVEE